MSPSKLIKSTLFFLIVFTLLLVAGLFWLTANDRAIDYDVSTSGISIPTFTEQTINFVPSYDKNKTIPFTASAIIDIDGDGIEEVFFGGGIDQADAFYRFENGTFNDITTQTGWKKATPDKTFGSIAFGITT